MIHEWIEAHKNINRFGGEMGEYWIKKKEEIREVLLDNGIRLKEHKRKTHL